MQSAYPLVLTNIEAVRCVVVGGGAVAERKVRDLLEGGARPVVVSPTLTPQLESWRESGRILHIDRSFEAPDVADAFLVVAATNDPHVNAAVAASCRGLVNVADDPDRGNFHTVATVRRGDLLLTVSTGGSSPALAAHIRRELAERYGESYARLTQVLRTVRANAAQHLSAAQRKRLWQRLLAEPVITWLATNQHDRAVAYADEQIAQLENDA